MCFDWASHSAFAFFAGVSGSERGSWEKSHAGTLWTPISQHGSSARDSRRAVAVPGLAPLRKMEDVR